MPDLEREPMVSTTTAIKFERNPNYGGGMLVITHDEELEWVKANPRFKALYPNNMELVKRRSHLLIRLIAVAEEAWHAILGTLSLVILAGVAFGVACFVLALLLYLLGPFAGVEIIVVTRGH
jgi:hypothetical protein